MMHARNVKKCPRLKQKRFAACLNEVHSKFYYARKFQKDANVLPVRFVLSIKSYIDGEIKYKARYVIGVHRDKMKNQLFHSTATLQPKFIRLLLALASIFGFEIWTSDVRQAYLQASEPIFRNIFIGSPAAEF